MTRCDYAACQQPPTEKIDGYSFCRRHTRAHRDLFGPQADPQTCEQRVAPSGCAYDLPVVNVAHARTNVSGRLLPSRSLRPVLAVLNRDSDQAGAA